MSIRVYWWLKNDDFGADQRIISRFLSREGAHHRAVVILAAGRAQSPFHQRGHESVRPDLSRTTKAAIHNDLEDVGLDTYHHTFFEMLGNWSFGDYFKKEAIEWAWELLVERWNFPAQRLYATVYKPGPGEPSEFDQEAYDHWANVFREADLDPAIHVLGSGKADNFWMMGDTGPCGPCSEVHVDLTPDGDTRGALVNKEDPRCIEIWNLVFIQFNANPDGTFTPLPQRHVDTGMGFERVTAIIQGTKNLSDFSKSISNYETDIFRPIFDELEKLSRRKYGATLPKHAGTTETEQEKIDVAFRVIADHIRALTFAIADGIIPSNEGRGYVLRRILRRAVSYGCDLDIPVQFLFKLVSTAVETMSPVFPELAERAAVIQRTIKNEEDLFNKTMERGFLEWEDVVRHAASNILKAFASQTPLSVRDFLELTNLHQLNSAIIKALGTQINSLPKLVTHLRPQVDFPDNPLGGSNVWLRVKSDRELSETEIHTLKTIPGAVAFKLYDTYGFPLDLSEVKARELRMSVDVSEFERLMEQQRSRARASQKKQVIELEGSLAMHGNLSAQRSTRFLGYDFLEAEAVVETIGSAETRTHKGHPVTDVFRDSGTPSKFNIVLDQTPCYAEMGGQVGDTGLLHVPGHDRTEVGQLRVTNTQKRENVFIHRAMLTKGRAPEPGEAVRISVDADRRKLIQGHHTVTHLLHWALHEVVSRDAAQKGSYVGPDKLTFDFSSAALTKQQVRDVEKLVNKKIAEGALVSWTEIPYAEARKRNDIIQFFGEKYGDTVRVLQIGGAPNALNGYSMELCGGTHVRSTEEIGPFRIVKEEAIAAGIRRIEAVAGDAARKWAEQEAARQKEKFATLARKKPDIAELPVFESNADTAEMLKQLDARAAHLEKVESEVREWEKNSSKAAEAELKSRAAQIAGELTASHAGKNFCAAEVADADGKLLQAVLDALKPKFKGPIFLIGAAKGSVALVASIPKEMTSKFQANKIIQEIAPIIGGKGGGRPESAQGGGTDSSKVEEALAKAKELLS